MPSVTTSHYLTLRFPLTWDVTHYTCGDEPERYFTVMAIHDCADAVNITGLSRSHVEALRDACNAALQDAALASDLMAAADILLRPDRASEVTPDALPGIPPRARMSVKEAVRRGVALVLPQAPLPRDGVPVHMTPEEVLELERALTPRMANGEPPPF